jgi:hypothetical protein
VVEFVANPDDEVVEHVPNPWPGCTVDNKDARSASTGQRRNLSAPDDKGQPQDARTNRTAEHGSIGPPGAVANHLNTVQWPCRVDKLILSKNLTIVLTYCKLDE